MATDAGSLGRTTREWIEKIADVFWSNPLVFTLKVIAAVLLLQVIIGTTLLAVGLRAYAYISDPIDAVPILFFAWILMSKDVSKLIIGTFLVLVFALSVGFLIVPIEEIANVAAKSLLRPEQVISSSYRALTETHGRIELAIRYLDPGSPALRELRSAQDRIQEIVQKLPPGMRDEQKDAAEKFVEGMTTAISNFLQAGAPFVFAMLMGLLGSSIVITQQFVTEYEAKPPVWYLYRMLQGMIMALLIVYGLVAGMLSLGASAQPIDISKFESNKYFIGFVSALAGLFSEQAFSKLQDVSATIFGKRDETGTRAKGVMPGATEERKET